MFAHVHRPAKVHPFADLAQVDDRVGVGQQIALVQRPLDQAVERGFRGSVEQHAADRLRIVGVARPRRRHSRDNARGKGPAQPTRRPCAGSDDKYTRTARSAPNRWADRPARCRRSPPVARRGRSCGRKRRWWRSACGPVPPCQSCQASKSMSCRVTRRPRELKMCRHSSRRRLAAKKSHESTWACGSPRGQFPAEHPPRIFGVTLRIAPGRHVENDARPALLLQPGPGELQAELGLADARGTDDNGQRARQQAAAQPFVEAVDPRR